MSPEISLIPFPAIAFAISAITFSDGPSNSSLDIYGNLRFERFGSPRPTRYSGPSSFPAAFGSAFASSVVRKRKSGLSFASASAVVNNFIFEAGTKYLSAFSSNSTCPVLPSAISNPQSPFAGCPLPRIIRARAAKRSTEDSFGAACSAPALASCVALAQHFSWPCGLLALDRVVSCGCPASCALALAAKHKPTTAQISRTRTLRALNIGSTFPLLEYSRQAKYIPYATEHFLEAGSGDSRPPSILDSGFRSSNDIAKLPHLRAHQLQRRKQNEKDNGNDSRPGPAGLTSRRSGEIGQ